MPIIVKDFTWKQTEQNILIQVPLYGIHPSKTDIFSSPRYIKVSFEQYFFEVLLFEPVDISSSKCTKTAENINFELLKCKEEIWPDLEPNISKKEKMELKIKLIEAEHKRLQYAEKEKVNKKAELKRVAVREQIALDSRVRENIEKIRKEEENLALGDLNKWKSSVDSKPKITELQSDEDDDAKPITHSMQNAKLRPIQNLRTKHKSDPPPKPRSTRSLQVLFTPREFPTPSRESKLEEEKEFLRKQVEARRSAGFISEDIRQEERNPQFLKSKGDEFMRNKNYLGAISAYSFGIKLSKKYVDLYIARSEAHLAIGNLSKTIEDCSEALDLLKPAVPINLKERALCLGRRGVGLYKIGLIKQGIGELEASLKLQHDQYFEDILNEAKEALINAEYAKKDK